MITAYAWQVQKFTPPWYASADMQVAIVPDHPEVNANNPVRYDPDGSTVKQWIVEAYNRHVAPNPTVTLDDFEFGPPPDDFVWPDPNEVD